MCSDEQLLRQTISELGENVGKSLREEAYSCNTIKIKLRWPDFTTLTRQLTLSSSTDQDKQIISVALALFDKVWKPGKAVRLIGVGVSGLVTNVHQLSLWDDAPKHKSIKENQLLEALDELRERYGEHAIRPASDLPVRKRDSTD